MMFFFTRLAVVSQARPVTQKLVLPKSGPPDGYWLEQLVPRTTTFSCQKWSPLAITGPIRTKFGNQKRVPLFAAESGLPEQFGLLRMVLLPCSDC